MNKIVSAIMGLGVVITTYISYNVVGYVKVYCDYSNKLNNINHSIYANYRQRNFIKAQDNFANQDVKNSMMNRLDEAHIGLGFRKLECEENFERFKDTAWYSVALGRYELFGNDCLDGILGKE